MIRSCRIPPILNRVCDDVIHSALLVTADGELLGASTKKSTASLFATTTTTTGTSSSSLSVAADAAAAGAAATTTTTGTSNGGGGGATASAAATTGAIENLGTLIADIAVDYHRLGEEYAGISGNNNSNMIHGGNSNSYYGGGAGGSPQHQQQQQQQYHQYNQHQYQHPQYHHQQQQQQRNNHNKSQLQCLLMELECGLVAVSSCGSFDCLVIAIASPNAPLGVVKAKIQTLAEYVQEALSPLAENT